MRDAAVPAFLACACAAAGVASGLLPAGPLARTPEAYVAVLSVALSAWLAVVVPSLPGARPRRLLEVALAAVPFFWLGHLAGAPLAAVPWIALGASAALGLFALAAPAVHRRAFTFAGLAAIAGPALLAGVGAAEPPPQARAIPARDAADAARRAIDDAAPPADDAHLHPRPWRTASGRLGPLRAGALARSPAPDAWDGPPPPEAGGRWMPVPSGAPAATLPARGPVVALLGSGGFPREAGGVAYVERATLPPYALDLDAFDALVVLPGAEEAGDPDVLASFARRGGLLVGPAQEGWPGEVLARRLGPAAGVEERGPAGARSVGLGHLARAGTREDVAALLEAGLHRPAISTAFDRARTPPAAPPEWPRWRDEPDTRRDATLLAWFFAVGATAASLWRGLRGALGVAALAALACAGIAGLLPARESVVARAFVLDLGGEGGRRVEGVHLSAGPAGWRCPPGLTSRYGLRVLGFRTVREGGRLVAFLPPGREGWVVEEKPATGPGPGLARRVGPAPWSRSLTWRAEGETARWRWWHGTVAYSGPLADALPGASRADLAVGAP